MGKDTPSFRMTEENIQAAQLNTLVTIYAHQNVLTELILSEMAVKTKTDFEVMSREFESRVLKAREKILDKMYENYGSLDQDSLK